MVCRGDGVLGYFVAYGPSAYNAPHDTAQVIGGVAASIAIAFGIIAFLRAVGTPRARACSAAGVVGRCADRNTATAQRWLQPAARSGPAPQHTMNKEWQQASNEKLTAQKNNPLTGITSQGYKGKGFIQ